MRRLSRSQGRKHVAQEGRSHWKGGWKMKEPKGRGMDMLLRVPSGPGMEVCYILFSNRTLMSNPILLKAQDVNLVKAELL